MEPHLAENFGNPSSLHRWGRAARNSIETAREGIADLLGVDAGEVFFVRGGTEADNLAVLGRARPGLRIGDRTRIVVSAIEHSAVREAALQAEREGAEVHHVGVDPEAGLDLAHLDALLDEQPALVSIMWVNNEIGAVLPVAEVGARCRAAGVPYHTDAVQALGRVPVHLADSPVDLVTFSGHKLGGPKGTGVLVLRSGIKLDPLHYGGGQEDGIRPGTQDVAGAVGVWTAFRLALGERESEAQRLESLRDSLAEGLSRHLPDLRVHGAGLERAPHILNVGVRDVDGATLMMALDLQGVAVSQGSACSSGASRRSHVLEALYGEQAEAATPIRFSLGLGTDEPEIEEAVRRTVAAVEKINMLERVGR